MFKTALSYITDERKHYYDDPGERVEDDYKEHFTKDGVRVLRPDGKRNTFDEIQSHRESVDINVIMKRYQCGDFAVLDRNHPMYLDTTQFPKTFAECFEIQADAKRFFYELDPDTRAQFNNSFEQFLNAQFVPNASKVGVVVKEKEKVVEGGDPSES